jgi:type IV secretory pathway VirB4 component
MFSHRSSSLVQGAGACADEIALLRFIDDITFETKLGDLGMILSLAGIDPDCRTDEVLNAFTRRYESAMRSFDDRFRVYSYIIKRSGATPPYREHYSTYAATVAVHRRVKALEARSGSLYEIKLYLAVLCEGFRPQKKLLGTLQRATEDAAGQAGRALEILSGAVRSFQSLMDDLQRFDAIVYEPMQLKRLKLLVLDECWRWMLLSEMGPYMVEKLKAGRKYNLGNIFVAQSGLDAERAGYAHC